MQLSRTFLERLQKAYSVVVVSGAGMSAASGIPTFRGKDGLWNKFKPHELANLKAFLDNPERVWEWYNWRRELIRVAKPNLGHYALVDMAKYFPDFQIITQNVDGLHQRAGSTGVIELHGNIMRDKCISCSYEAEAQPDEHAKALPHCPECRSLLRPAVIWFGEMLPQEAIGSAQRLSAEAELIFSVGTSGLVEPAASLPYLARGNGAYVVEVNPDETPLSSIANERFAFSVEKFLPALSLIIQKIRKPVSSN
jgi:NAD-dependent deacetylase